MNTLLVNKKLSSILTNSQPKFWKPWLHWTTLDLGTLRYLQTFVSCLDLSPRVETLSSLPVFPTLFSCVTSHLWSQPSSAPSLLFFLLSFAPSLPLELWNKASLGTGHSNLPTWTCNMSRPAFLVLFHDLNLCMLMLLLFNSCAGNIPVLSFFLNNKIKGLQQKMNQGAQPTCLVLPFF